MTKSLFELCCFSSAAVELAAEWKVARIELCANRNLDGTTPTLTLCEYALANDLLTYPIIRSRGGNFVYDETEINDMCKSIMDFKSIGVKGVVIGALTKVHSIDKFHLEKLVNAAEGLDITFHRAFDVCFNQQEALEDLIAFGIKRVLTSGGKASAIEGRLNLQDLHQQSQGRISIMAGGGIGPKHVEQLKQIGLFEFHGSLLVNNELPDKKSYDAIRKILD